MASRIAHHIDFPDYSGDELMAIAGLMLGRRGYRLGPGADTALRRYIGRRIAQPNFGNARSIRNAIDRARLRQAARLFELDGPLSPAQLVTIEEQDILASSVFAIQTPAAPAPAAEAAAGLAQ
jgi:hypothetical protein